jgi:hypothetical protein
MQGSGKTIYNSPLGFKNKDVLALEKAITVSTSHHDL